MNERVNPQAAAQRALQRQFAGMAKLDGKGYVSSPQEILLPDISLDFFEEDLRAGDGDELRMKFCAAHSSSALQVNTFAWFRAEDRLQHLTICGKQAAKSIRFERRCRIFRGGRAPNLDVWIEFDEAIVAVESKLTEYFAATTPEFRPAYDRLEALAHPNWWNVYQDAKKGTPSHLDRAQLVKHYFGLEKVKQKEGVTRPITLLYLYWEPTNARKLAICEAHREEIDALQNAVSDSDIRFKAMSYAELWKEWELFEPLSTHLKNLRARYEVEVLL